MSVLNLRLATPDDLGPISGLIARSVHGLMAGEYASAQREAGIEQMVAAVPGLVAEGTYFVVERPGGALVGAGGWSSRRALHGGPGLGGEGDARVDPAHDPARIRAFFVDPDSARQGVGLRILRACEAAARAAGFAEAALSATLTSAPFYARQGYAETGGEAAALPGGVSFALVHMRKRLR